MAVALSSGHRRLAQDELVHMGTAANAGPNTTASGGADDFPQGTTQENDTCHRTRTRPRPVPRHQGNLLD